jgi:ABC-2 type transport system ATP-binding protein
MITLTQLSRSYGDFKAVADVSFTIQRGEVVGLLGHNGAGKTTIMRMLTGYLEPSGGSITIDGADLAVQRETLQRRIGYLPENCPVWPEMTVVEFLNYQAALHQIPARIRAAAVARAIARTDLKGRAMQTIQTLSRGYRQRVGVAQAILHQPDIVILDEPTNGLDPTQILHMRSLLRELARTATVLISTHILQEVQAVCGRVIILRAGTKVIDARLDELQRQSRLRLVVDGPESAVRLLLAGLAGVQDPAFQLTDAGRTQVLINAPESLAPIVCATLVSAGVAVFELYREQRTLESVFADVNAVAAEARHAA